MIRKIKKFLLYLFVFLALLVSGLLVYVKTALPDVGPAPEMVVEITPERVARGEYMANHVMLCMDCHSTRDWSIFSAPLVPGTEGVGGEIFDQTMGFPGKFISKNLTPTNLGDWTDGEIFRAITTGVTKDGKPIFPVMPHPMYGQLDEEEIKSVIAYIRTLKPIESDVPESEPDFPMNFIINTIPKKANFQPKPPKTDKIAYGKYVITAAACKECHTQREKGEFVGPEYAGGMEFLFPDGSVLRSPNITPHKETGIGNWTRDQFVNQFKSYVDSAYVPAKLAPGDFQTVMPWQMYAGMEVEDLEAIYAYIMSLEPVNNKIERFTPAVN